MSVRTLSDITELIVDTKHKTPPFSDQGYPYIRTPNIGPGFLILDEVRRVDDDVYKEWTERAVPSPGDLILAREAPVGNVAEVQAGVRPVIGQRTVLIRPRYAEVDSTFLMYWLLGRDAQAKMNSFANGSTVPHLNMSDIRAFPIPDFPSRRSQERIAEALASLDRLVSINERRTAVLEQMAELLYREWFVHYRFPGAPEDLVLEERDYLKLPKSCGWEVQDLATIAEVTIGQSPKSEYYNEVGEGLPFHQGVKGFGDRFPTHSTFCTVMTRIAEAWDILLSVRAPVGRLNFAQDKLVIGRGLHAIRSRTEDQEFLFQALKDRFYEEDIMGGGTIYKSVTKADVLGLKFVVPPRSLLEDFRARAQPMFRLIEVLDKKNRVLRLTRDLLLPQLISGAIDPAVLPDPS